MTDAAGTVISTPTPTSPKSCGFGGGVQRTEGAASGTSPTDYLYTSQRQEAGLGLYFYNARWYDPALARFTQADTIVPGAGNPQAFDRYAYVLNNPLSYNDPSGNIGCKPGKRCLATPPVEDEYHPLPPPTPPQSTATPPQQSTATPSFQQLTPQPQPVPIATPLPATPQVVSNPMPPSYTDEYLDGIFDPYNGVEYPDAVNPDIGIPLFAIDDLYQANGIDIKSKAASGQPNPLTFDDINDATAFNFTWHMINRANHVPYQLFLRQVGLPHDIVNGFTNYEPQYLNALMVEFPGALDDAKADYLDAYPNAYYEHIQDIGQGLVGD